MPGAVTSAGQADGDAWGRAGCEAGRQSQVQIQALSGADCAYVGCAVWATEKTWPHVKQKGWRVQLGA